MYTDIKTWLGQHPNIVLAIIASLTVLLLAAMFFGLDLSWMPAIFLHLFGIK